jgi:allophanate hydrolase
VDAFKNQYRLMALRRQCEPVWSRVDFLMLPTAATIYTIAAIEADPIRLNSNLGIYTNFMNLLDLTGVAVPAGFRVDGLPFGVTLSAPAGAEAALLKWAATLHRACGVSLGATPTPVPAAPMPDGPTDPGPLGGTAGHLAIAVCGAHMSGLPLNHQLRERGAHLVQATRTAPLYRLFALRGGRLQRPGLVRTLSGGVCVEVEVWSLPLEAVGSFLAWIPAPLGLGCIELADGSTVTGFLCETYATSNALDISEFGGWRAYLTAQPQG